MSDHGSRRSRTRLFVENLAKWQSQEAEDRRLRGVPEAEHVHDGLVLPIKTGPSGRLSGGVLRQDGTQVTRARHLQHAARLEYPANVIGVYPLDKPPVRQHGTVIYAGGGGKHKAFGHFLVEELARLWYLVENPEHQDLPVVFINPEQDLDDAGFRLLELAGVSRDRIVILTEPTAFDDVIVPDQSLFLHPGSMHVAEARETYDRIRDGVAPGPYEKVYLTYRHVSRKQTSVGVNEKMIEDLYERNGFTVIAPEKLSVHEQISVISGAREIACTAGTLSHLVAFAQDGVALDIFVREKNFMPEIQWSLNAMRAAQVNIVDTLRPVFPGNARRGVTFYTSTPQWAEFALERFGSSEPSEPPTDYVEAYLVEWAQLLGSSRKWALDLALEWRASDLVESIYETLMPSAGLTEEQKRGLRRRFYAPERRIDDLQSELRSRAAELGQARLKQQQLEQQLDALSGSRSWQMTRPLRGAAHWWTRARKIWQPLRIALSVLTRR